MERVFPKMLNDPLTLLMLFHPLKCVTVCAFLYSLDFKHKAHNFHLRRVNLG